mmetsp:Transcript_102053/g.286868  ORF Transcript_102053/g.286868 Transcript_102053/m.286868 type:complete len:471 (+) Transcript_102053:93-1505(+)
MLKKAFSLPLASRISGGGGLSPSRRADAGDGDEAEEHGCWHYLVTDSSGIRPRVDSCYSKESKSNAPRFTAGSIVQVSRRRRSGWTRWLEVSTGAGWLFDVSPKDRKVRLVEVEVQQGEWAYEVCVDQLVVMPRPQLGSHAGSTSTLLRTGDEVKAVERVRPLLGRGAFLRLSDVEGWVLDFIDGQQTVRMHGTSSEETADPSQQLSEGPPSPLRRGSTEFLGEPEEGHWSYVVLDPKGITLRSQPTYDKGAKLKSRLEEGELVNIVERRSGADTRFLRVDCLGSFGWVFDQQPGSSSVVRMMEVMVEEGSWFYQVLPDRGCALRSRCSISVGSKVGAGPQKGAVLRIGQRVKVGSTTFLRQKNGSGWLFDCKDGKRVVDGPLLVKPMRSASATIVAEEGAQLLAAPTAEAWAQTKRLVLRDAKVTVLVKVVLRGVEWMEVSKPGGMQGWVPAASVELEDAVFGSPGWAR